MKKILSYLSAAATALMFAFPLAASAVIVVPPEEPPVPVSASECKQGGWKLFGDLFKNQGDCVSFVATVGKNEPSGPSKH